MPFLRHFLVAAAIPLLAFLLLGIYLQPLRGDLTRLGNFSERSWGWNRDQPAIHVRGNDPRQDAAVLVIGDSFSAQNRWQSVAAARLGLPITSFQWSDIGGPGCLPVALATLKRQYPRARMLVIEAVERTFVLRFDYAQPDPATCPAAMTTSIYAQDGMTPTRRDRYADPMPDPVYAIRALWADVRNRPGTLSSGPTSIAPLARADLFSNRRSDAILFHNDDLAKGAWRPEQVERAIANARQLSASGRALGLVVTIAVVPDKLTVYAPFLRPGVAVPASANLWRALDAAGVASVGLDERLGGNAGSIVDLYLPDDTHVGSRGYIEMGEAVAAAIAPPPAR